jgi:hypothetical protein
VHINLDIENQIDFIEHRSGWSYALSALKPLHDDYGVFLDGFVESSHSWHLEDYANRSIVPYTYDWIGFMHNPPSMPIWFDRVNSPQIILARDIMRKSLEKCLGLFVLSEYHKNYLSSVVDIPVCSLVHPTHTPQNKFTVRKWHFNQNRSVIALGYWLRQIHSIQALPTKKYPKVWIITSDYAKEIQHREYDEILSKNIIFLDLYDVSACNSILECIVRNTPIVVRKMPAVVEYFGDDYPLYFSSLEEAAAKIEDDSMIVEAHEYLRAMDKKRFTSEYFLESFVQSDIGKIIGSR